jgi:diguanylate cyclase (GGDEF)-like protein
VSTVATADVVHIGTLPFYVGPPLARPAALPDDAGREAIDAESQALVIAPYYGLAGMIERADQLARIGARLGDATVVAWARLARADVLARTEIPKGAQLAQQMLRWAVERNSSTLAARAHMILAGALDRLGSMAEAVEHAGLGVELLAGEASLHVRAQHAVMFAMVTSTPRAGKLSTSVYEHAAVLADQLADPALVIANLNNLAWAQVQRGDLESAFETVQRFAQLAAANRYQPNAFVLDTIAHVLAERRRFDQALAVIDVALTSRLPRDEPHAQATCLLAVAAIRRKAGELGAAMQAACEARELADRQRLSDVRVPAIGEIAKLHAASGDFEAAYEAMATYHDEWEQLRSLRSDAAASTMQALFETELALQRSRVFEELANVDHLTQLHNRRYLYERLPALVEGAIASGTPLAVAMIDLDYFKRINDMLSHDAGDDVLREVARVVTSAVGSDGFVVRLGGEEFLATLSGCDARRSDAAAERIRAAVAGNDWSNTVREIGVTVSVGVANCSPGDTQTTLLRRADENLYRAKQAGRNCVRADWREPESA